MEQMPLDFCSQVVIIDRREEAYDLYLMRRGLMFANERLRKIRSFLLDYKKVDMNTLCNLLDASISTVRRDLDKLEQEGFLTRIHGGAILVETAPEKAVAAYTDYGYVSVAALASKLIQPNEILFLGGGNLCLAIARAILQSNWSGTVVTNNLNAACELAVSPLVHVNCLGGDIINNGGRLVADGAATIDALQEIVVNRAFVTVTGYSIEYGIFVDSQEQALLYRALESHAMEIYLVLTNKFNRIGRVRLGGSDYFKRIITLPSVPENVTRFCIENNIALFTSFLDDASF